jgi:transcriptional regulator of arginine metabolism
MIVAREPLTGHELAERFTAMAAGGLHVEDEA